MSGLTTKQIPYATGADAVAQGDLTTKAMAEKIDALLSTRVRKLFDEAKTNAVLFNDTHLKIPLTNGVSIEFEFWLYFSCASAAVDAQIAFTFPAGVVSWGMLCLDPSSASNIGPGGWRGQNGAPSGTVLTAGVAASGGSALALVKGTARPTANGTLQLQWAQNTATAGSPLTLQIDSFGKWGPF